MRVFADSDLNKKTTGSWVKKYSPMLSYAQRVVVIGCGSGVYLTELLNAYPEIVIEVIEMNEDLFHQWKLKDSRARNSQQVGLVNAETASRGCLVLDCQAEWGIHGIDYALISAKLKEVDVGNIKNICHHLSIEDQSFDAKVWRALKEMVR